MPIALIIGAVAVVLLAVGISFFNWRVYARPQITASGPSIEVGVGGGGSSGGGSGGGIGDGGVPWIPIALVGVGAIVLVKVL